MKLLEHLIITLFPLSLLLSSPPLLSPCPTFPPFFLPPVPSLLFLVSCHMALIGLELMWTRLTSDSEIHLSLPLKSWD